jgi:hypothetical protein
MYWTYWQLVAVFAVGTAIAISAYAVVFAASKFQGPPSRINDLDQMLPKGRAKGDDRSRP